MKAQKIEKNLQERMDEIQRLVASTEPDAIKFDKGVKSAGMRVRKTLAEIKVMCKDIKAFSLGKEI